MHCIIYSFQVKPGQEDAFLKSWADMTDLIYQYEGSLGSRLHKEAEGHYIAYAQWPDAETYDMSGEGIPNELAGPVRAMMRASCSEIKTLFRMDMVDDRLA
ncbi:MAG: antibiotic biosynthesis monooxygenase family protein [Bacteroidia bacterium]